MKTNYPKLFLAIMVLLVGINYVSFSQTTIYSTAAGGPWDSTWAWIGGVVPTGYNDVVINGPIYTSNDACYSLTITSNGALYNNYYSYTLSVTTDVVNHGIITNNANQLYINIGGDITNDGEWSNSYTYLTSDQPHNISCQNGNKFTGYRFENTGTGDINVNDFAYFDNVQLHLNNCNLNVASNATLKLHDGYIYLCNIVGTGTTSIVYGEGTYNSDAPYFSNISFTDLTFQGDINIENNCSTHGNIINNGSLQNNYYAYALKIYDNFRNNGTIQNYTNSFTMQLYGDFVNNGTFTNNALDLYSDSDQNITELNGNAIQTTYLTSFKPSGKTYFLTDMDFTNCSVNMQNDTIIIPDNGTIKLQSSYFTNAVVYATPSMNGNLKLNMDEGSFIENCHVYNPEILNKVKVKNNQFYGNILVTDTLENDYYSYTLEINGDIMNNGVIQNFVNPLTINITGNITNNGVWNNSYTNLTGTTEQHITCTNGNKFAGYEFQDNNMVSNVIIDDTVYFDNVQIKFNNNNFIIPTNTILKIHGEYLYACNLIGAGSSSIVYGEGAYDTDAPYFSDISFTDLTFQGNINIANDCSTHGNIINNGSLQNSYYAYALKIYDNFRNNGTIQNYTNSFTLQLYGDFVNNGTFTNNALDLYSDSDQNITELNGNAIHTTYLTSFKPSGKTYFLTDMDFLDCVVNMDNDTLVIPGNGTLTFQNSQFKNAVVYAGDTLTGHLKLNMDDGSFIQDCHVYNPEILNIVKAQNNYFYGNILVTDTLENNYYSYTVNIKGDIVNNGVIRNFTGPLTLNITGNITNNGIWENSYTNLTGTTEQHITCTNGNKFAGYEFIDNNMVSNIFIDDTVYFDNVHIDFSNNNLILPSATILKIHSGYLYRCNLTGNGQTSIVYGEGAYNSDAPYFSNISFTDLTFQGDINIENNCSTHGNIINNGSLQNSYYAYALKIYDNFRNNGTIQNYTNSFTLQLYGDFVNNGTFTNNALDLYSDSDQNITELNGNAIQTTYLTSFKPSGKTCFLTDMDFTNCIVNMQNDTIIVPDNGAVKFQNSLFKNTVIYATSSMGGALKLNMDEGSFIENCHVYNPEILNKVKSKNNQFYGNIIVTDTLENDYYSYTLEINGDIVNNGVIQNFVNSFTINITGNITNNGIWNNSYTNLTGTSGQHITCLNGNMFSGYQFTDNNTMANVYFEDTVYFDNTKLVFNNNPSIITANSILKLHNNWNESCNIIGENGSSTIYGLGTHDAGCPVFYMTSLSGVVLDGEFKFSNGTSIYGNTVNNGSIYNDYYSYTLEVYDDFINNGTISSWVNSFTLDVFGDITNKGVWSNSFTVMKGTSDQKVTICGNNYITGQLRMVSDIATSPYQWVLNGSGIPPNSLYFNGENSQTLICTSQIDNTYYGTYYCITGGGNSRNIIIQESSNMLDIHVILEGSFDGTNIQTGLNSAGLLPLTQPYSGAPWNYNGTESVTAIPANVVDWVLIELRDAPSASQAGSGTVVERMAAFVRNDELVVGLDGVSPVEFTSSINNNMFIVVYHRNHLAVMSANPVTQVNGYYYYDFTAAGQAYNNGEKNINGTYVMFGGDANANGTIGTDDITAWQQQAGMSGYLQSDVNFDGQADNKDKNDIWNDNNGTGSTVPD